MTNRVSQHTRNSAAAIVAIAFAASVALVAAPAAVQADAYQQVCTDAWDDAPASEHCAATVTRLSATNPSNAGNCNIAVSSCEISVLQREPGGFDRGRPFGIAGRGAIQPRTKMAKS